MQFKPDNNQFDLGDIIFSTSCKLVSNLVVTYADEQIVGASTILKIKKNSREKNVIVLKNNDQHSYVLKTFIIKHEDIKKHNWIIINKQIKKVIVEPQPVKNQNVIFDFSNSNLGLKFTVHQCKTEKKIKNKIIGEIKHEDFVLYSYVSLKRK